MTKFFRSLLAAFLLVTAAAQAADNVGLDASGTAPSSATTAVGYTSGELGLFTTCSIYFTVQGVTGGTLDVYIQTAFKRVNASPTWVDVVHLPQVAAAAAPAAFVATVTRFNPSATTVVSGLNTTSATPALTVNTVVPGLLGYMLRVVYKTGVGTSAGTAQVILINCSAA